MLLKVGFWGVNVMVLYKELVLLLVVEVIEWVWWIGVVNMLIFLFGGGFEVDNIDGVGFMVNLWVGVFGWWFEVGFVVLLGVGGVVWVVLDVLLDVGVFEVWLVNWICVWVEVLVEVFGLCVIVWVLDVLGLCVGVVMVVNVMMLGMDGVGGFLLLFDGLEVGVLVIDLIYVLLDMLFL